MVPLFGKGQDDSLDPQFQEIIDAATRVHDELKFGYAPEVYAKALAVEFQESGIPCETNVEFPVTYKGRSLDIHLAADLRCAGDVLVLVRAVRSLSQEHLGELVSTLNAAGATRGLLLNFGGPKLEARHAVAPPRPGIG